MKQYEKLFKEVSKIVQQEKVAKEESRLRGENFNIFKVCGIDHYELQHSAIIAEMLDPHGSHGQGCLYLKLFMEVYGSKLCFGELRPEDISVKKEERSYDDNEEYNGRMDIFVEYKKKPFLIIENKLFAKDQSIQLKKYNSEAIRRKAKEGEYEIVYLTLDGKDASDDSGEGVIYNKMSYSKDIIKWLDLCIKKSSKISIVRETLIQYQNHIKQLTHQDMDSSNLEDMFDLMSKFPEETAEIVNNSCRYLEYVFNKFVKGNFERFALENGLKYKEDGIWNDRKEGGFFFHKAEWEHYAVFVWHDTWSDGFYVGVSWFNSEPQKKLEINNLESLSGKADITWPYGFEYLEKYRYWDVYTTINMINGKFVKSIRETVLKVVKEIEEKGLPMY